MILIRQADAERERPNKYNTMISLQDDYKQRLETASSHTQLFQLFEHLSYRPVEFSGNRALL